MWSKIQIKFVSDRDTLSLFKVAATCLIQLLPLFSRNVDHRLADNKDNDGYG